MSIPLRRGLGLGALCFFVVAVAIAPYQLDAFQLGVLTVSMVFALLAMGVNLMAGSAGLVSLGHAGIMAAGGYGFAIVHTRSEAPLLVQLLVGLGVAMTTAFIFGMMSMRTSGIYFFMATVAQGLIVWGLAMRFTRLTNGETGIRGIERPGILEEDWQLFYAAAAVMLLALLCYGVITRSPLGLILRAMSGSPSRLGALGYDVRVYKVYVFVISGVFAGLAGILYVYYNRFISPEASSFLTSGKALLMVLLGGAGYLLSPVIGALLITGVENVIGTMTDRWPTVLGLLYVLVVLFAPGGVIQRCSQVGAWALRRFERTARPESEARQVNAEPSSEEN